MSKEKGIFFFSKQNLVKEDKKAYNREETKNKGKIMKKIKEICWKNKKTKILTITGIISILLVIAILAAIIILNYQNNLKTTQAEILSQEEAQEEIPGEEISMEELEEQVNEQVNEQAGEEQQTEEIKEEENTQTKKSNGKPYYIKVNYGAQVVTIYGLDSDGNYTVPVKAMVCSTGEYTPKSGVYKIPARWEWLRLQGYVWGHYSTQITGNILFHSVPYLKKGDPASLEYWEYDKLGTYASAGCVRLTVADAKWIYDNCANGTYVEFSSSSNPGPLGKPTAKKISNMPDELRNWDPTDSNPNNPWHTYKEEQEQPDDQVNEINEGNEGTETKNEIEQITNTEQTNTEITNTVQTNTIAKNEQVNEEVSNVQENNVMVNEQQDKSLQNNQWKKANIQANVSI